MTTTRHLDGFCLCAEPLRSEPANWPNDCRRNLRIHWHPAFRSHRAFANVDFRDILRQACNAWEAVIDARFQVIDEYDPPRSDIYLHPHAFPGSVLADAQLAMSRCDVSLRGRYDTTVVWRDGRLFSTLVHELGHHLGLHHDRSPQASLYFSINADWKKPHARDVQQAMRLGYRKPTSNPPKPNPPPKPDDKDDDMFDGIIDKLLDWLMNGLLKKCLEENGKDETALRARRRGPLVRLIIRRRARRIARKEHGKQWLKDNKDALDAVVENIIGEASETEIEELVEQANEKP